MVDSTYIDALREDIRQFQMKMGILNAVLIAIGGCVFGIGTSARMITRIIVREHVAWVRMTCDMMIYSGLSQVVATGYCCFSSNWKLPVPIYIGIAVSGLVILLEMCTLAVTFYLPSQADIFVNENIYRAWYLWECERFGSCNQAFLNYFYYYMIPQSILTTVATMFQCLEIMYLTRLVRCIKAKHLLIWHSREEDAEEDLEEPLELESTL